MEKLSAIAAFCYCLLCYLNPICEASLRRIEEVDSALNAVVGRLSGFVKNLDASKSLDQTLLSNSAITEGTRENILFLGVKLYNRRWKDFFIKQIRRLEGRFVFLDKKITPEKIQRDPFNYRVKNEGYQSGLNIYEDSRGNLAVEANLNNKEHLDRYKKLAEKGVVPRNYSLIITDYCVFYYLENESLKFLLSLSTDFGLIVFLGLHSHTYTLSPEDSFDYFNYFIPASGYYSLQRGMRLRLNCFSNIDEISDLLSRLDRAELLCLKPKLLAFFNGGIPRIEDELAEASGYKVVSVVKAKVKDIDFFLNLLLPQAEAGWYKNISDLDCAVVFNGDIKTAKERMIEQGSAEERTALIENFLIK